ncbi:hypothetical protein COU60_00305 [Candidatus Pacearchaeota archaeon CG10_big_fil_rev_8_21_14_0_10_34_76]|nr:MAG: hypothetical protein COU60_00305 [Candidatus Pacearchaeota archaeon CG10_big_fil_rev_8_21_14_0_10_34_76]
MAFEIKNKKGQVAIFVVIALVVVAIIILFFVFLKKDIRIDVGGEFNPENYVERCVRGAIEDKLEIMLPQGGFVDPKNYHLYNDINVGYLCDNINRFDPCITQYPDFVEQVSRELERETEEDIEMCFYTLEEELDSRGFEVSGGEQKIDVNVKQEKIEIKVIKELSISKGESVQRFSSFNAVILSPLGKMADIAGNFIAYEEARNCYAENLGYVLAYGNKKNIDIKKAESYDSTRVYTIIDTNSGKEMNIAIRGCVLGHGFYGE